MVIPPLVLPTSPPSRRCQALPQPATSSPVVAEESSPLAGLVETENIFINRPAEPDIKVSKLKPALFFLPNNKIFVDKALPESEPSFIEKLSLNPVFSPTDFIALHERVYAPGPDYPGGTYNYKGAKISLTHTRLNIPAWRHYLADYYRQDLVNYLEYGFPIGVDPDGHTQPCLKNHSSSYMFYRCFAVLSHLSSPRDAHGMFHHPG